MDQMITDLKAQQADEVKTKTECTSNFNKNEKEIYHTEESLKDTKEKIENLEDTITQLTDEIAGLKAEIADMEIEIKQAGLNRQAENAAFQTEISDQRAVQHILNMAIDRLKKVYGFIQKDEPVSPVQFQPVKKNAGGSPVISMMESIVEESK